MRPAPDRRRALNRYANQTSTAVVRLAGTAALAAYAALSAFAPAALAAPSCAEGPQTVGETIVGTPCPDTIQAPRGITTVYGEGGGDTIYGGRGNQRLYGGEGDDRLFGGIGDDMLRGGPGDDLLSGGFGADSLDGEEGGDYVRGDATIDYLGDTGGNGDDTLSFATGATPGFPNSGDFGFENFPEGADNRGVFVELGDDFANDGLAPAGGGLDRPLPEAANFEAFETIVGSPFSDFIVGGPDTEAIYGGGGADVILDEGSARVDGGAGGDYCESGGTTSSCEFEGDEERVAPADSSAVDVGLTAPSGAGPADLYAIGSEGADKLSATLAGSPPTVTFRLLAGSTASFDAAEATAGGCTRPEPQRVVCVLHESPDSLVLAGLGGADSLSTQGFSATTSMVELGGDGEDALTGTEYEDALVDGAGDDTVRAGGGDDALPNNQGRDTLSAEAGNDLFISDAVCEGDDLDGGEGVDNANWANFDQAVSLDLGDSSAGLLGPGGTPDCEGDPTTALHGIEAVEGTDAGDTLIGDAGENQLLGRGGADSYYAGAGDDTILANSGTPSPDPDPVIDCGEGFDTAEIDYPQNGPDATPVDCEVIYERAPNSFRPPDTPPGPESEEEATSPPSTQPSERPRETAPRDRTPPQTWLLHRPARRAFTRLKWRKVAFALGSSEAESTFRCKLDGKPLRPCSSPRAYRVRPGRHAFRAYAIDAAGNPDRSPVLYRFEVRRLSAHSSRSHRHRGSTR
jgi:Ca2+-binding RTX toxin-like protein